jgi:replicative DNA helicase
MAQSIGMNLLARLLLDGRSPEFFKLKRDYFIREELEVYDWLTKHVERHALLPSFSFARKRTALRNPDSDDPYGVWHHEYLNRAIYNRFNELLPKVNKLLSERKSEEALDSVVSFVERAESIRTNGERDLVDIAKLGEEVLSEFTRARDKKGMIGIPTGYPSLDATTQGYQNGTLIVLAARPGVGKSTFAIKTMLEAHRNGRIPLFVSMEMKRAQIGARLLTMASGLNLKMIKGGHLTTFAEDKLIETTEELKAQQPMYVLEGQFRKTVNDLRALVQSLKPHILIIDGAYLMKLPHVTTRMSLWERIGEIAERLNNIGLTESIPVFATFQINREGGKVKQGHLGVEHLMLADAIGQLAHLVMAMLAPEGGDSPDAEKIRIVKTLKGREGEEAEFTINWDYERMDFSEILDPLTREQLEPPPEINRRSATDRGIE